MRPGELTGAPVPPDVLDLVAAHAPAADITGGMDDQVVAALGRERLLAPMITTEYGGLGRSSAELGAVATTLNTVCTSARSLVTVQSMVAAAIVRAGSDEQRDRYLPLLASGGRIAGFCLTGTGAGSDALDLAGAAVDRSATPWRLSGQRLWVTFGRRANLLLVVAGPRESPVAVLIDTVRWREPVRRLPRTDQLGLRGCEIADLEFDRHPVDSTDVLADNAFQVSLVAQTALDSGRYTVACGAAGIVVGCLREIVRHTRRRVVRGGPLAARQLVRGAVADLVVHAETSRSACVRAAETRDAGDPDAIYLTMVAKLVASRAAAAASTMAVQLLGSSGLVAGAYAERSYRDAKVLEIIEGSTDVTRLALADWAVGPVGAAP
jgi:methoxymalonate biosynthesis protein